MGEGQAVKRLTGPKDKVSDHTGARHSHIGRDGVGISP